MTKSARALPAAFAYCNAVFAWGDILTDVVRVGHLRAPMPGATKLDAQAEWEAGQTIPLLITLACCGGAAVMSQLNNGLLASLWVGVFGVCAWFAVRRVGCTYQAAFVAALEHEGLSPEDAEAVYQSRYGD
jgi:hypothetical protein